MSEGLKVFGLVSVIIIGMLFLIGGGMAILPIYGVWQQGLKGEAELRRAEQNRKITIQEAMAKLEAADYLNQAEVMRAEGVAKANEIVQEGLGGPEGYLRYLWINGLEGNQASIIYVPTEAGIPILEAGRGLK